MHSSRSHGLPDGGGLGTARPSGKIQPMVTLCLDCTGKSPRFAAKINSHRTAGKLFKTTVLIPDSLH